MKLSLALFALAAAQDDSGSADAGYGDAAQTTGYGGEETTGYEAPSTGYEAPSTGYESAGYEAAPTVHYAPAATKICLGSCPAGTKCQDKATGACSAIMQSAAVESYATQSYASPATESYGAETQEAGYRNLQEETGCPAGSINIQNQRLHSNTVLWIGFGLLFVPALYFFWIAFADPSNRLVDETGVDEFFLGDLSYALRSEVLHQRRLTQVETRLPAGLNSPGSGENVSDAIKRARAICGAICLIASLAYLTMALGYGYTIRCDDGRQFFYARYIDWAITTPLLLYKCMSYLFQGIELRGHQGAEEIKDNLIPYMRNCQNYKTLKESWNTIEGFGTHTVDEMIQGKVPAFQKYFIYAMDILMIVAGLIGSLVGGSGSDKWFFFAFSMLCFIPVMYYLCLWNEDEYQNPGVQGQKVIYPFKKTYNQIITLTVFMWMMYPVIWILAEGTSSISAQAEAVCYTVLDVIAKSVFGFILCGAGSLWKNVAGGVTFTGSML